MALKYLVSLISLALSVNAANYKRVACAGAKYTATNAECCAFFALRDDLQANLFAGVCGEEAHESLRLAFHDAIAFSPALIAQGLPGGGGADGSMITFPDVEPNFAANNGIIDSVEFLTPFLATHNVSAGDLIQFAAAVGITNCPGAPQLSFVAGRPGAAAPAPDGLVPEPQQDLDTIFARIDDAAGFTPDELVALLASHTIARSDHIEPGLEAVPFDSTPFTFDTQFFLEVLLKGIGFPGEGNQLGESLSPLPQGTDPNIGEVRILSDEALARDARTACTWQSFVDNQNLMNSKFKAAMAKLAVVGQNAKALVDCSEVIPVPIPAVMKPATFPAGKSAADLELNCNAAPFPTLATDVGPATLIPHCPPSQGGEEDDCDGQPGSLRRRRK